MEGSSSKKHTRTMVNFFVKGVESMRVLCLCETVVNQRDLQEAFETGFYKGVDQGLVQAAEAGEVSMVVSSAEGGVETLRRSYYDLVVLEQESPHTRFVSSLRKSGLSTPIVVIARETTAAAVADVLGCGADDCVRMGVDPVELLARMRAVVRRFNAHDRLLLQMGRLSVDVDRGEVFLEGVPLSLTPREYDLIKLFVLHKGHTLSKEALLDNLYTGQEEPSERVIDVMMCNIRKKLRVLGVQEPFITVHRVGYRLNQEAFSAMVVPVEGDHTVSSGVSRQTCLPMTPGIVLERDQKERQKDSKEETTLGTTTLGTTALGVKPTISVGSLGGSCKGIAVREPVEVFRERAKDIVFGERFSAKRETTKEGEQKRYSKKASRQTSRKILGDKEKRD